VIENIAVLFTDLVSSTEVAAALTPDAADALRRRHFSLLRRAVAANGGTEVKNLGDGVMVVFRAASAALSCAVAMQQAVARENAASEQQLGLRIGVSSGEATRESSDYFGDPVVEAARLCALARAGQVLVAELVRANAGRRSTHAFVALGAVALKGLSQPVDTLELLWSPLDDDEDGAIPLPGRLVPRPGVGVIGRDAELATLSDALKHVSAGAGCEVVLVGGEPGQGKSTLVSEVARRAHEGGATVLLGRCAEEVGSPYRPFEEAFRHYVAHAGDGVLGAHVVQHGGELARLVPSLRQRLVDVPGFETGDQDSERYLLFAAAVSLLDTAAEERPVVLLLEDLHWADPPSLQMLRYLVANTNSNALLVLGTYRDADIAIGRPLNDALAALRREHRVSFLALGGIGYDGVVAFMESAAGHELGEDAIALAAAIYGETDGNPFFVSEVLRHLSETGVIVQDETGRWSAARPREGIALPESLRQVIGARVARLGAPAAELLLIASVIGREFDLDLLAAVASVDEDAVLNVLEVAQAAALVHEALAAPGRYGFSHALVQLALYEGLGPTRRARLHYRVGEALERLSRDGALDRAGELARHYSLASGPERVVKAVEYARAAGDAALASLAPEDALHYFSQALGLVDGSAHPDEALRADLLTGLGVAQLQTGSPDFRETLLDAARSARAAGDNTRLVTAALANNRGFHSGLGAVDRERVEVLEAALGASLPEDSAPRARLLATLCCELTFGPLERRLRLAADAKAMARRLRDPATFASVCNLCGVPLRIPSELAGQFADATEALGAIEPVGDPISLFWASNLVVIEGTRAGEFDVAARSLETMKAIAGRVRQPMLAWTTLFSEAAQAILHGHADRAEALATEALDLGTSSGQPDAFANYGTQLMGVRLIQGRAGELVDLVRDIAERHPNMPTYRSVLGACLLDAGDVDGARGLLEQASGEGFALPVDTTWLDGIVVYTRLTIELEEPAAAGQLFALLEPHAEQVPYQGLTANPPVATLLGGLATVLGRYSDAERYLDRGAELSVRGAMDFAITYSDLLRGRLLLAQHDARSVQVLEAVGSAARGCGYALLDRRAAAALGDSTREGAPGQSTDGRT
jgi:class 3 adenylate cyclase